MKPVGNKQAQTDWKLVTGVIYTAYKSTSIHSSEGWYFRTIALQERKTHEQTVYKPESLTTENCINLASDRVGGGGLFHCMSGFSRGKMFNCCHKNIHADFKQSWSLGEKNKQNGI